MSQTVDQITLAWLKLLAVKESGENLTADESADGLQALNELIDEINLQNLFQVNINQISQAVTSGDDTYTFGTGGDNSTRPLQIFKAFVRDAGGVDYPVNIISNDEYSEIGFKSTSGGFPFNLYFRNAYPLATVKLWPVPGASYTLYLECKSAFANYSAGVDVVDLPAGYIKYIKYQLAVDNGPEYKEASPTVRDTAMRLKELIQRNNNTGAPSMANPLKSAVGAFGDSYYLFGGV